MEFLNRVTVVFKSATDAVEFLTQRYGKFLAGHKLKMSMVSRREPIFDHSFIHGRRGRRVVPKVFDFVLFFYSMLN